MDRFELFYQGRVLFVVMLDLDLGLFFSFRGKKIYLALDDRVGVLRVFVFDHFTIHLCGLAGKLGSDGFDFLAPKHALVLRV